MKPRVTGVCRLCKNERQLHDSHLLSAGFYRAVSDKTSQNPHPILLMSDGAVRTSRQIRAHALCGECEQRLNKRGEDWVLDNFWREAGDFPLRQKLTKAEPVWTRDGKALYKSSDIAGIDKSKLACFALSIFWRASLVVWPIKGTRSGYISLGLKYEENLRKCLLDEAELGRNLSLWIWVSDCAEPLLMANVPSGVKYDRFHGYHFTIPGVFFSLIVGAQQPEVHRQYCFVKSADAPILLTNDFDQSSYKRLFRRNDLTHHIQLSERSTGKSAGAWDQLGGRRPV